MKLYPFIKNIFAIFGIIATLWISLAIISETNDWKWSRTERIKNQSNGISIVIERGINPSSSNRIKVSLENLDGHSKEVWSSYEKVNPSFKWESDNQLIITTNEEESHYYWPSIKFGNQVYNVKIQFR